MKLYHGSTVIVKSPNIQRGRKATDFGKGFYTTTNFEQAKKWAILKQNREQSKKAVVSIYEIPDNILPGSFLSFGLRVQPKSGWSLLSIIGREKERTDMI